MNDRDIEKIREICKEEVDKPALCVPRVVIEIVVLIMAMEGICIGTLYLCAFIKSVI